MEHYSQDTEYEILEFSNDNPDGVSFFNGLYNIDNIKDFIYRQIEFNYKLYKNCFSYYNIYNTVRDNINFGVSNFSVEIVPNTVWFHFRRVVN